MKLELYSLITTLFSGIFIKVNKVSLNSVGIGFVQNRVYETRLVYVKYGNVQF